MGEQTRFWQSIRPRDRYSGGRTTAGRKGRPSTTGEIIRHRGSHRIGFGFQGISLAFVLTFVWLSMYKT